MELCNQSEVGQAWNVPAEAYDMRTTYEILCQAHPGYRDPANERRAALRRKQQELGDAYPEWYWHRFLAVDEFAGAFHTLNPIRSVHHARKS